MPLFAACATSLGLDDAAKERRLSPQSRAQAGTRRYGVSESILEGLDEILTVTLTRPDKELRPRARMHNTGRGRMS